MITFILSYSFQVSLSLSDDYWEILKQRQDAALELIKGLPSSSLASSRKALERDVDVCVEKVPYGGECFLKAINAIGCLKLILYLNFCFLLVGVGVFALRDIRKGELIAFYEGDKIGFEERRRRVVEYKENGDDDYIFYVSR